MWAFDFEVIARDAIRMLFAYCAGQGWKITVGLDDLIAEMQVARLALDHPFKKERGPFRTPGSNTFSATQKADFPGLRQVQWCCGRNFQLSPRIDW